LAAIKEKEYQVTQENTQGTLIGGVAETTSVSLRFEHQTDPLGIGTAQPRLSWIVQTSIAGWHQNAYEIEAYAVDGQIRGQTGRVESDQSVLLPWPFAPLQSR
jgi:alpha-L-rhamnosidase